MGKTKTAFVTETKEELSGAEKYKARQEKKAHEASSPEGIQPGGKVHVSGLKGGQRVVAIDAGPVIEEGDQKAKSLERTRKRAKVRSKSYKSVKAKVDINKKYSIKDAIKLLKETSYSKFDGSAELHATVRKEGLSVNVSLPHYAGKEKKIEVADDKTLEKLKSGKIDFDVLLATAEMMPKLVPFARLLGPKGMMPNPKNGTLIKSAKEAEKFSGSSQTVKTEKKAPVIHTVFGKVSQDDEKLEANLKVLLEAIGAKQIEKAVVKATMGPAIKLQI